MGIWNNIRLPNRILKISLYTGTLAFLPLFSSAEELPPASGEAGIAPLELTVTESALMALENNVALRIERLNPAIGGEYEEIEKAVFDPQLTAEATAGNVTGANEDRDVNIMAGVTRTFATGTTVGVKAGFEDASEGRDDERTSNLDIEVTQALLQGRGRDVNLARIRQAAIDTELSRHELRGVAEALLTNVETAYWECILAREKIDIYTKSLEVAEQQIEEVRERINVGKVAELELAAAEAEVAEKREQLIAARGDQAKRLLLFRRLVNPVGGQWTRPLNFIDRPQQPDVVLDAVENHVRLALENRPDLAQSHLEIQHGELEVVRTRNGLLPRLDLFVRLGGTHYAWSFDPQDENDDWQMEAGLVFDHPWGRREDKARDRIATLSLQQAEMALTNMEQLVQYDVRSAYVQVGVAQEQIAATAATRKLRQDTLTAEQEKFRVGTSTTLQVAQAWRDLIGSQINEIEAVVSLRESLIELYRLEGTLLQRRRLEVPGASRTP